MSTDNIKLILLTRLFHPHIGGVEVFTTNLISILEKKNYKITVVTERYDNSLKEYEIINKNTDVIRINVGSNEKLKKFLIWKWIIKNRKLFFLTDIIHANDVYYWLFPLRIFFPMLTPKSFVTFYGWEGKFPISLKSIFVRKISELLAMGNICIGEFITKWYKTNPNFINYGGVHIDNNHFKSNIKNITFLGRLDNDTGFDQCVLLYNNYFLKKNFSFTVVGDGMNRNIIPPKALFTGFVENPIRYIKNSSFLFTTGYLGILEGMSQKKLILSTYNNPVKRDYLYLHPMSKNMIIGKNYNDIIRKFNLLNKKEINYMITKSYNWAKEQTWEKLADIHEKLWGIKK